MIVITLTDCPLSLRGDLTKWLFEINTGVFVGRVSARVRDRLWERVLQNVRNGRATLVYTTNNEQHMEFRLHNTETEIVDYDGLKLVRHPSYSRTKNLSKRRLGFSKASRFQMAKKSSCGMAEQKMKKRYPQNYCILDIETTGLHKEQDSMIEVGILQIRQGEIKDTYEALIRIEKTVPPSIEKLTGITMALLQEKGQNEMDVLADVLEFIGGDSIVGHHIDFDMGFLNEALEKSGATPLNNRLYDTQKIFHQAVPNLKASKKLLDIADYYGIKEKQWHRALADCRLVKKVYDVMVKNLEE